MIALNDAIDRGDVVEFRRLIKDMNEDELFFLWMRMLRQRRTDLADIAGKHFAERSRAPRAA